MVRKEDIYIPCFQTMRTLHVYLPVGYENNKQKYPVFYMYDVITCFMMKMPHLAKAGAWKPILIRMKYR